MNTKDNSQLKNPNVLRIANQLRVIDLLKEKPQSCPDLANKLSLSNVALKHITDELSNEDVIVSYVKKPKKNTKKKGRLPSIFSINTDNGVLCAIDLSGRELLVAIADLNDNIIARGQVSDVLYIDDVALNKVVDLIKELLNSSEVKNRPLLGICISSPGEFDQQTKDFTYAPRIINYEKMNFCTYFEKIFHVNVSVCNDVNLGLLGEYHFGNSIPKEANNVYFVFLDHVAGSALMLNGEIYVGSRGHAGEPSSFNEIINLPYLKYSGRFFTINDIYADIHESADRYPEEPFYKSEPFDFVELVNRYKKGDRLISEVLDKSAKINAIQLLSVTNLLDLDYICLEGKMMDFGSKYRNQLCNYYREFDANKNLTQIIFSSCGRDSKLLGAIKKASEVYFVNRFVKLANKRTNSNEQDVEEFFRSKI